MHLSNTLGREVYQSIPAVFFAAMALCLSLAQNGHAQPQSHTIFFNNNPLIDSIKVQSEFHGFQSAIDRDFTGNPPGDAYDYSAHLLWDDSLGIYRLYSGGRWKDAVPGGDGDHVLEHHSSTGFGSSWTMPQAGPEFLQGQEECNFTCNVWYGKNYIEPEVFKVGGTYYLYTQVQIDAGDPIDQPGLAAITKADRIQLHTSTDGDNWQRWSTERGVVINLDDPQRTHLHHQEMVYVPWEANGQPYWMYVAATVDDVFQGYQLMKSSDPTTFDWQTRTLTPSVAQLGNQIGHIENAPGGPSMVRITFTDDGTGRKVPSLQFSKNGINWTWGNGGNPTQLAGSTDNNLNQSTYFLGLSTIDGTGALEYLGNNRYRAIYAATTSNSPLTPDIFASEIGVGELTLTIVHEGDYDQDGDVDGSDFLSWQRNFGSADAAADGNNNGVVDAADLTLWEYGYGYTSPPLLVSSVATVPEPSTAVSILLVFCVAIFNRYACRELERGPRGRGISHP